MKKILEKLFRLIPNPRAEKAEKMVIDLAMVLNECAGKPLSFESQVSKTIDVTSGRAQEAHIYYADLCSDLYHNFHMGVSGYSCVQLSEIEQFLISHRSHK